MRESRQPPALQGSVHGDARQRPPAVGLPVGEAVLARTAELQDLTVDEGVVDGRDTDVPTVPHVLTVQRRRRARCPQQHQRLTAEGGVDGPAAGEQLVRPRPRLTVDGDAGDPVERGQSTVRLVDEQERVAGGVVARVGVGDLLELLLVAEDDLDTGVRVRDLPPRQQRRGEDLELRTEPRAEGGDAERPGATATGCAGRT